MPAPAEVRGDCGPAGTCPADLQTFRVAPPSLPQFLVSLAIFSVLSFSLSILLNLDSLAFLLSQLACVPFNSHYYTLTEIILTMSVCKYFLSELVTGSVQPVPLVSLCLVFPCNLFT